MIQILLIGCNGHMGRAITQSCRYNENMTIVAGVDAVVNVDNDYPVYADIFDVKETVDIIIDFSHPKVLNVILKYALEKSLPLVIATTGHSDEQKDMIEKAASSIPILLSANMSLGINLMVDLVKRATKLLHGSFDIEIIEKHHNQKIDAPSGTALLIADAVNSTLAGNEMKYVYDRHSSMQKRTRDEIGIHSIRGGTITGEHTIIFAGNDEMIEIKHTAVSKSLFAEGALKAASFLYDKTPGYYKMQDIFE
ncbi:MAG: 4-hydroxy-tetrahydrodipicolinate reductase [Acetivibrionales bacterium]|jgi:4-hydroxy-tetrahydrodipicolinate reductase|nr:4-hydroxy-tetrahydrodipicolinate reductase [Clostridiaceae bacterium]